jgi:hypothetical protein
MKKRLLAILLTLCMVAALLPTAALAGDDAAAKWDGTTATGFAGGDGTQQSPYQIATGAQLAYLAQEVNKGTSYQGVYFKLTADIDLAGKEWTPIGSSTAFQGIFDGCISETDGVCSGTHTISNLNINLPEQENVGLFGYVQSPAVVKNLTIENVNVVGKKQVGALAGEKFTSVLDNCHIKGDIVITGNYKVGGLCGDGYTSITNCSVVGNDKNTSKITGIAIEGNNTEGDCVGGLIGYRGEETCETRGCSVKNVTITGTRKVGGLFGYGFCKNKIENCSVDNVDIVCSADLTYATDNEGSLGIAGLVGIFNYPSSEKGYVGGQVTGCSVSNVSISCQNEGVAALAKIGLLSGGYRDGSEGKLLVPTDAQMHFANNSISGVNSVPSGIKTLGETTEYDAINGPAIVAKIGDYTYSSLADAISDAKANDTITLVGDVTTSATIEITKNLTIDLNTHTITGSDVRTFQIKAGTLELAGQGTVTSVKTSSLSENTSVIRVGDGDMKVSAPATTPAGLIVGEKVLIDAPACYGVGLFGSLTIETLEVNGKIHSVSRAAITGNGSTGTSEGGSLTYGGTTITINSTAEIITTNATAIYLPQDGITYIKGGVITGSDSAVGIKCGTLDISSGKLTATGADATPTAGYSNGINASGAAIQIESNDSYRTEYTKTGSGCGPVKIDITGGEITSQNGYAIYEYIGVKEQKVLATDTHLSELNISGGEITGAKGVLLISEVLSKKTGVISISGGTFSSDVTKYCALGKEATQNESTSKWEVGNIEVTAGAATTVTTGTTTEGTKVASVDKSITGQAATDAQAVADKVQVEDLTTKADVETTDKEVADALVKLAANNVEVSKTSDITITHEVYLDVTATAYDEMKDTLTLDITPKVNVTAAVGNSTVVLATGATASVKGSVEVSVTLVQGFTDANTAYISHEHEGTTYLYKGTIENNVLTFTNPNGFSSFTISTEPPYKNWINPTEKEGEIREFDSLEKAVANVQDGETINFVDKNSDTIYVGRTVTFTLDGPFDGQVVASNIYTTITPVKNSGTSTTYTCVYTAPSVPVYRVVVNDAEGGKIKASANKAAEGATIVLTPVADDEEGELETLAVVDEDGNAVTLTKRANGTYSFVMPAKAVTVTGTFTIVADPEEPDEDEEPGDEEEEATVFTDVDQDAYYAEAVAWAVANEITKGTSETTFSPDDDCTRAQVVTFLWRYAGKPEPTTTENPFTDVEEDTDYYKAILWAYENGITTGTSETTFSPDETCTRAQVVTFLWRYEGELTYEEAETFTDVAEDAYYAKAVAWAVHEWITKGTGDGQFSPDETCSRGQVVTFLYRDTAEG